MLTPEMLLNVIKPETMEKLGLEKVEQIKITGYSQRYAIIDKNPYPYCFKLAASFGQKKLLEMMNSSMTKSWTKEERLLLGTAIRFCDDEQVLYTLKQHNITKEDIEELNNLVRDCQNSQIKYTLGIVKLEKDFNLALSQVKNVIKIYPAVINSDYELNEDDKKLYNDVRKFYFVFSSLEKQLAKQTDELNNNEIMKKMVNLGKHNYNLTPQVLYLLLNKVNELMLTNPDKIEQKELNSNQKTKK